MDNIIEWSSCKIQIEIILHDTAEISDGIYKLRHTVFSEEENKFSPTADAKVNDRYETSPGTGHFPVMNNKEVVGGMRATFDSPPMGVPLIQSFH